MTFDVPRNRLREMGVPEDMSADDVVSFFSLPDDDTMHQQNAEPICQWCLADARKDEEHSAQCPEHTPDVVGGKQDG